MNFFELSQKNLMFWSCFVGHWIYYLNRKAAIFSIPVMLTDSSMTLTMQHFGMMASIQMTFYTVGKFLTGFVVDRMSCRRIFSAGMFVVGMASVAHGVCTAPLHLYILAAVNGLFQACAWNSIAVFLKRWFHKSEFGTAWSLASTSINVSNSLSPFIVLNMCRRYQWRNTFYSVGSFTVMSSLVSYWLLKDHPVNGIRDSAPVTAIGSEDKKGENEADVDFKMRKRTNSSFVDLLKSPIFWILSLCYLLWCVVKNGTEDWLQTYLITERQLPDNIANFNLMAFQIGGLSSTIASGVISDILVEKFQSKMRGTPRLLVVLACSATISLGFYMLHFHKSTSTLQITTSCILLGVCCYGPATLFGIIVMENAPMELSGSAHALVTTCSSVGMALGGYPLIYVSNNYGWNGAYICLMVISMLTSSFLLIACQMTSEIVVKRKKAVKEE